MIPKPVLVHDCLVAERVSHIAVVQLDFPFEEMRSSGSLVLGPLASRFCVLTEAPSGAAPVTLSVLLLLITSL